MEELLELIHSHDFEWRMSDDQRIWNHGYETEMKIIDLLKEVTYEDIEDHVKEQWRKDAVRDLF